MTARLTFFVNFRLQRISFLGDYVRVVRTKSLVPYSELAHDPVSGDTIEPSVMPFPTLDPPQFLSLLPCTLLPLRLVFNLLLVVCVDIAETYSDDIQYLFELVGQRYTHASYGG